VSVETPPIVSYLSVWTQKHGADGTIRTRTTVGTCTLRVPQPVAGDVASGMARIRCRSRFAAANLDEVRRWVYKTLHKPV